MATQDGEKLTGNRIFLIKAMLVSPRATYSTEIVFWMMQYPQCASRAIPVINRLSSFFLARLDERKTRSNPPYRHGGIHCVPKDRCRRAGRARGSCKHQPQRLCRELWSEGHLPQHRKAM